MKLERAQKITEFWNHTDDGVMSTKFLFSIVSDHFDIDDSVVAEALRTVKKHEDKILQP